MSAELNKYKRKRKKSFLKNAKKYAKKGCYGRGSQLEADTYQYFVRIMEVYREGFDNQEDKLTFVNNVFEQTEDQEVNICCNQVGCRVIEMLLPFASDDVLKRFMDKLGSDMRKLCSDPFASHVLQSLFAQACRTSLKKTTEETACQECKEFTLKLARFLLNNLEDYVWDTYGNHIIRTVIENMSQTAKEHIDMSVNELPEEYQEIIKEYGERLLCWPQFKDLPYSEITSGLLQIILVALKKVNPKLLKRYLKTLNDDSFSPQSETGQSGDAKKEFCDVFYSKPAVMLLETSLQVAPPKQFTQIYAKCFMSKLAQLAMDKNSNFAVQKLLLSCSEKSEFEAMYDELVSSFKEILEVGHTGVLLAITQACKKLSTKQGSYMQAMMKCLNCFEPEERQNYFVLCMTKLTTYEEFKKLNTESMAANDKLNLHGTLIIQEILHFHKPIKIVNGLLYQETPVLKKLFCNSIGSHIADAYVQSPYVGEKSREKLIRKLKGTYQELASSKYGSRVFEALWNVSTIKNRLFIMDELIYKDALWSNSEFGKIIASKINFHMYKRNKEEWKSSLDKTEKKKLLFADITK